MQRPFRVDLHVHTGRYSQCAESLLPSDLAARALAAGLHGVVITEHDVLWAEEEIEVLQRAEPALRLFRGVECSARGAHLVVIGIDDAAELHRGMSVDEVAGVAHRHGAAVILAHPYRDSDPGGLPFDVIDAVEVASTSFTPEERRRARALARRFGKPKVAGSDAHALSRLGWAWTELESKPQDERELAAWIREGRGKVSVRPRRPVRQPKRID